MNISDYILIGIILVSMIIGGVRGIIMSVYGLLTTILSAFLAFKFAQPIRDLLVGTSFYINMHEKIENMVEALVPNLDSIEETLIATINSLPFPDDIKLWLINGIDFSQATSQAEAMGGLVVTVTDLIIAIMVGLVLFLILIIIFKLLKGLIKKVCELPIIKQVDSIVGAIVGALSGVLLAYIICLIVSGFQASEVMNVIHENIQESKLASVLYNNNLLLNMFKK
ncbi:MAG TPA: CvpA family protein [Clostridia bacterium]|nr:CvpA family protein [Clostridia bacterium]